MLQAIRSALDLSEEEDLLLATVSVEDDVIQLRNYKGRDDKRAGSGLHSLPEKSVLLLLAIQRGKNAAAVHDEGQSSLRL